MTGTGTLESELETQEAGRLQAAREAYSALVVQAVNGPLSADDADKLRTVLDVIDLPMKSPDLNAPSFEKDVTTLRNVAACRASMAEILVRHGVKDHKEFKPRMAECREAVKAAEEALKEKCFCRSVHPAAVDVGPDSPRPWFAHLAAGDVAGYGGGVFFSARDPP